MKRKEICLLFVKIVLFNTIAICQVRPDTTAKGLVYVNFTKNKGERINLYDVVTFNFIQKTDRDSVLFSTYETGKPVRIQVKPSRQLTDLMDILPLLTAKDSVMVKIPADSIFKDYETSRPSYLPSGSSLVLLIKIEKVQTMQELMDEAIGEMEKRRAGEKELLSAYIARNHLHPLSTPSGLLYTITKSSKKIKPLPGDTVIVNYTVQTLEGKIIDTSIESDALKAGLEQADKGYGPVTFVVGKGQVIKGWDEGMLLMNEGAQFRFIIPSKLGFGWQEWGEDIKPFSTLILDVELLKVSRAQKTGRVQPGRTIRM